MHLKFNRAYLPRKSNSAADALSRIGLPVPIHKHHLDGSLPDGLLVDGSPVAGGCNSLFTSLLRSLSQTVNAGKLPRTDELRELLVDNLINNASKYKIKLARNSRKQLRLMHFSGQIPSVDVLMVASCLYKVKIYV